MYENDRGVTLNYAEAAKWFRKAAEQGNAWSSKALKKMKNDLAQKWIDQCLFENIEKAI
jgi:TPR repeat protein